MSKNIKTTIFAKPKIGLEAYLKSNSSKKKTQVSIPAIRQPSEENYSLIMKKACQTIHLLFTKTAKKGFSKSLVSRLNTTQNSLARIFDKYHHFMDQTDELLLQLTPAKIPSVNRTFMHPWRKKLIKTKKRLIKMKNVHLKIIASTNIKIESAKSIKKTLFPKRQKKSAPLWKNYQKIFTPWRSYPGLTAGFLTVLLASGTLFYVFILRDLPSPNLLTQKKTAMTTIIRDRNGNVLYRAYNNANRVLLSWDEIPDVVKKSTIAIEDAEFYHHHGISLRAIFRAFLHNLNQDDIKFYQGGSTITQQLVKNRFLDHRKSYIRKLKEVTLALWTELKFSKQEILTFYLNEVGYGGPAYGIEAASQMYFAKGAKDLKLSEAALLAGLPAAPTTFSPFGANPQMTSIRQNQVLNQMLNHKIISKKQYEEALNQKIVYAPQKIDIKAPHFVMYVKNELVSQLGEQAVEEGGLDVVTTLDLSIQQQAEETVRENITAIGEAYNIHNAAALVTAPTSGDVLAMVGSVNYFDIKNHGYVNATNSLRQPGSSIKPVNYGYAFDNGFSPNSTIVDAPVVYKAPGSTESYAPVNYDGKFHGTVTLRSALANSYNVPAVRLLNKTGVENMLKQGLAMGIRSWINLPPIGLSLTLGGAEVTMLDMARAYGTIANLGTYRDLRVVKEIRDSDNKDLTADFYNKKRLSLISSVEASENPQVLTPLSAYWLTDILADNNARLPAFGYNSRLNIPNHKVAVKTGTSNNFRDNWTIGFTPDYLVATWVGNNDASFMNKRLVSGITGAAPIWNDIMTDLLQDKEPQDFSTPQGLIPVKICAVNGLLTCDFCPQEKTEYFTADKVPTKKCYFRSPAECEAAKQQLEGKSDEEKKALLSGCPNTN